VYSDPKNVEALVSLGSQPSWHVNPNIHLSFFRASPHNRWYPARHLDGSTYVQQWLEDLPRAGRRPRTEIEDPAFGAWLVDRGYADQADLATLEDWLKTYQSDKLDVRPSIAIERTWTSKEAVALDRTGALASQVRSAIDQVLSALGEPTLD
jgi:hypothetical protein